MKTKISSIIALLGLCVAGQLCANTLPVHIDPFNQSEYDEIVWGCRLSRCIHVSMERSGRYGGAKEKALIKTYEDWLETSGRKLIEDWRAGNPISDEDAKYLPLAKTEYWNSVVKDWDGSKGYFWNRVVLPDLNRFPEAVRADHEAYQAILEAGLPALHKIYNQQTLTDVDKAAFRNWALAYYCCYYINGVGPTTLPADSWYTANQKLQDGKPVRQGDIIPNVKLYNPYHYWATPGFDEKNYCDVSLHLRADKADELLQRYTDYAQYYEPSDTYPQVRPKCPPADAPDTDEYKTLYNVLKDNKPVFFATWLINNDEGNKRLAPRLHFLHRAWRNKINLVVAETSVNPLNEKNDLRFDPSENEQFRTHLLRCFFAPFLPTPHVSPLEKFFYPSTEGSPGHSYRLSLINPAAEILGVYNTKAMNGDFGGHLGGLLGWDKQLVEHFKNGFEADPSGPASIPGGNLSSIIPGRMEQCKANGYNIKAYTRYAKHIDAIGEIIAVDTDKHTVTLLREEYHEEEYPTLALVDRFPTTYAEFLASPRGNSFHFDDLAARKKAGNSKSARTLTFKVNVGVGIFLNGDEQADETCLKVGDVASIVYLDDKGGYPHFIRAIRFNFPPTFGEVANTGAGTAELRGIDDDNLIVDQEITVTAKSSSSKMPDPVVAYKKGVCTFTYTPPPVGETVNVRVTIQDDGSTEFGGNDATKLTLKFTADGATLAQ